MDPVEKFLRKLSAKRRTVVLRALKAISTGNLAKLDIKPLTGKKGWFRCRTGDIRIVFVYDIQFRDRAYRRI